MPDLSLSTWSLLLKMDYRQAFEFAIEHGFQGVEFWSCPCDFWPGRLPARDLTNIRALSRKRGVSLAVHFWYGGNDLADLNDGHRRESLRQLKEMLRLCHRLGAGILVIHSGKLPAELPSHAIMGLDSRFTAEALRAEAIRRFQGSLYEAAVHAERARVVLSLENLGHSKHSIQSSYADLAGWVDAVGSPWLGITLDVGHAHLESSAEEAVRALSPRIRHVHLDDNDGQRSGHGELGTGTVAWNVLAPFLRAFEGMLSLEVLQREDVEGAVLRSKRFVEDLLQAP